MLFLNLSFLKSIFMKFKRPKFAASLKKNLSKRFESFKKAKLGHCTKKWSFPLSISSVNVTKSVIPCGFGHIFWGNSSWKTSFFVQWYKFDHFLPPTQFIGVIVIFAKTFKFSGSVLILISANTSTSSILNVPLK